LLKDEDGAEALEEAEALEWASLAVLGLTAGWVDRPMLQMAALTGAGITLPCGQMAARIPGLSARVLPART